MLTSQTQTRLKKPGLTSFNCVCQQKTDYCGGDQVGRLGCKPESSDVCVCVCVCVTEQGSLGARGKVSRCVNTHKHTHTSLYLVQVLESPFRSWRFYSWNF